MNHSLLYLDGGIFLLSGSFRLWAIDLALNMIGIVTADLDSDTCHPCMIEEYIRSLRATYEDPS